MPMTDFINKKILYLSLKKEWFELIKSGEKKEEYREINPYWKKRIIDNNSNLFKPYTHVHFTLGYPKKDDIERHIVFEIDKIEIKEGKEEWGATPNKNYFVIVLGNKVEMGDLN